MTAWQTIGQNSVKNTAVAASSSERITCRTGVTDHLSNFNELQIINNDVVNIEIRLNGETARGRIFFVGAGSIATLSADEGTYFDFFDNVNLDTATAQTADSILFLWSKRERLD